MVATGSGSRAPAGTSSETASFIRSAGHYRLVRHRLGHKNLREFEAANQLTQAARTATFAKHEFDPGLRGSGMIKDPTRYRHRCYAAWRDDFDDNISSDARLDPHRDQSSAYADFAQLGLDGLGLVANTHMHGQSDRNASVFPSRRSWTSPRERLKNKVSLGSFFRRETNHSARPDPQAGQSWPPRHDRPLDQNLVGQPLARDLDYDRGAAGQLRCSGTEEQAIWMIGGVEALEFLGASATDSENVQNLPLN